tara:strand:- start:151 stop:840 length:690 start_codon:yes stop_codon:yes gene_type:complete
MCGRFTLRVEDEDLSDFFDLPNEVNVAPRYNIAPSQDIYTLRLTPSRREKKLGRMHWGLVPSWAQDPKIAFRLINARSETVENKPSFRDAFRSQRCLIPASGYYEWKREGKEKVPYLISHEDGKLMAFAGIWDTWINPAGEPLTSCSILTTEALPELEKIHSRMPLILESSDFDTWLSPSEIPDQEFMMPYQRKALKAMPLSSHVNSAANDDPRCLEPRKSNPQMELLL